MQSSGDLIESQVWRAAFSKQDFGTPPLEMPKPIWQILKARGISDPLEVEAFFSPQLKTLSHPFLLKNMDKAVERVFQALQNQEKIGIYADFDLDGTPGLALLKLGLEKFGFKAVKAYQPKRLSEGYGVHEKALRSFMDEGVTLVITVDVGITDVASLTAAQTFGLDVIVTDHHLPKQELPPAVAIVNPNQGDCPSNLGHLCGTGVAFYLLMALQIECKKQIKDWKPIELKDLLDSFAIATITDMVPLVNENRVLVKHGLKVLAKTTRPGLRVLLRELGLTERALTSQDIGFKLAPKLNSLSRLEEGPAPIDIFLAETEEKAYELVGEILRINEKRVTLQKAMENTAEKMVLELKQECSKPLTSIWIWSKDFHQGIIGLVASRLAKNHGVAAFVGAVKESQDGSKVIVGSARAPNGSDIHLLEMIGDNQVLSRFGGHAKALGFELEFERAQDFAVYLDKKSQPTIGSNKSAFSTLSFEYHGEGELQDFNENFMQWYESLGPYGMGFEAPIFLVKDLTVKSFKELRGGHFKFQVTGESHFSQVEALWFSPPLKHLCSNGSALVGQQVNILMAPQWNYYGGSRRLQLLVSDMCLSQIN